MICSSLLLKKVEVHNCGIRGGGGRRGRGFRVDLAISISDVANNSRQCMT